MATPVVSSASASASISSISSAPATEPERHNYYMALFKPLRPFCTGIPELQKRRDETDYQYTMRCINIWLEHRRSNDQIDAAEERMREKGREVLANYAKGQIPRDACLSAKYCELWNCGKFTCGADAANWAVMKSIPISSSLRSDLSPSLRSGSSLRSYADVMALNYMADDKGAIYLIETWLKELALIQRGELKEDPFPSDHCDPMYADLISAISDPSNFEGPLAKGYGLLRDAVKASGVRC